MLYVRKLGGNQMPELEEAAQQYRDTRQAILEGKQQEGASEEELQDYHDSKVLWDHLGEEITDAVLDRLIREQGGLCAYCMKPIERVSRGEKLGNKKAMPAHVEHFIPRNPTSKEYPSSDYPKMQWWHEDEEDEYSPYADEQSVNYQNLIAVCDQKHFNGEATCDAVRGSKRLHRNPCDRDDVRRFKYSNSGNGKVLPVDKADADTSEDIKTLNLNAARLKDSRKTKAAEILRQIYEEHHAGADRIAFCKGKLREFRRSKNKPEYYEMYVYFLCEGMKNFGQYPAPAHE